MSTIGNGNPSNGLINHEAHYQTEPVAVDWEKRYKDLQSYADKTRVGLETENDRLRQETTLFTPPKTFEELEDFRRDNPDWMGVIETVAHDIASNSIATLQEDVNTAKANTAAQELRNAHPDVHAIYESEHFKQWANDQGPEIQAWIHEEYDASKVIRALNYYKAMSSQAPVAPTQYNEPSASQAVRTHGSVVTPQTETPRAMFTREQINRMHPDEYERNFEAIKAQAQAGML
jgi:hypothetical protein